ncbi:hypothetical protein BGZ63DRAFT_418039 [Mariannaea sp. PMI_226]|nr:hypothetical protein BGZ63DRAFT_418039 [Mariannaea sp. PMI_226]
MDLPVLAPGEPPIRHADCCLGLSSNLFRVLTAIFYEKRPVSGKWTVLSVGSGTGLLEALLLGYVQSHSNELDESCLSLSHLGIEGVEVYEPSSRTHLNKYLPEHARSTVRGTWEISPRAQDEDVLIWMFTYPRQTTLVVQYVKAALEPESSVKLLVWLGPVADWDEFRPCFQPSTPKGPNEFILQSTMQGNEAGIGEYEMMAVFSR